MHGSARTLLTTVRFGRTRADAVVCGVLAESSLSPPMAMDLGTPARKNGAALLSTQQDGVSREVQSMARAMHTLREALEEQQAKVGMLTKENAGIQARERERERERAAAHCQPAAAP
jgi:hypothetical protein